jgi:ubiquinone/menaquinone biosynthesis C-methylase UbiE
MMTLERIEIIPVSILESRRKLVEEMRQLSRELHIGLGWHYLLDLPWAARQLVEQPPMRLIDAGAGVGIMQWWLADKGVDVISADRLKRHNLPLRLRRRFRIRGWRKKDLVPLPLAVLKSLLPPATPRHWHLYPLRLTTSLGQLLPGKSRGSPDGGTVFIYNQDLTSLLDIPDNSVDCVVSISALEHNTPDDLPRCVAELIRVLKPGGQLIATLGAAKQRDWYHEPSKGWCYTEATLRNIFDLSLDCPSNYEQYDDLFEELCNCNELRDNLADFYFKSSNNGMPWGVWDPKYQPVGVVKIKREE